MSEWKKEIHEELLALQNRSTELMQVIQLNWSQYRKLIQIDDPDKREYYELESVNNEGMG